MYRNLVMAAPTFAVLSGLLLVCVYPSRACAAEPSADAVPEIKNLGGSVRRMGDGLEVEFHLRGQALTDDGLARVAAMKNVTSLNLRDTKITSAGLVHLKGLTKLRWLHLERTAIGDEGFENLAGLANLEYLNLYATKITDKSLDRLTNLKHLRRLYVWQTVVTDEGVARLAKALPDLKIVRGVDLSKLPSEYPSRTAPAKPKLKLKWVAVTTRDDAPDRSLNGINTTVYFENQSKQLVKLYWITYGGDLKQYGELAPGATRRQNTYSRNSWLVTDANDKPLGYFLVEPDESIAVIPSA